jgi:peptide/nickel transport system substrate-binding protein
MILMVSCTRSCTKADLSKPTITIDVAFPIETLDPRYTTSATSSRVAKLVYASLFEMAADASPKPFLAESIEPIDEKSFKITLRKNLRFHDGSPLTAEDVVYTYQELTSSDVASPHGDKFDYLKQIEAVNNYDVIFTLKQPHAPFLTDLCAIGIVSKKLCAGRSQQCRNEYVGSGPYKVKNWDTAKEALHLIPFTEWFEGEPKSSLLFRVVRDENTRMLELIGKKADLVDGDLSPANAQELKKQTHLEVKEIPGLGYSYLAINLRGPRADEDKSSPQYITRAALAHKLVRRAIAHAIDFDQAIDKLLLKTADRVSGLIPNGHWAKDENLKPLPFDPKLAEQELDQAGFKRLGPHNVRFKLTIATTPNRMRQSIAELYADYLKRVGIDATVRVKEWSALYQDMTKGQFELFIATWTPVTDPDLYYFVHHSSNIPDDKKTGGNRHGYKNPEADRLIEMGRVAIEPEKRKAIYQEVERIMLEDLPYISLWNEHRIVIFNRDRLKGFEPSPTGSLLGLRKTSLADAP